MYVDMIDTALMMQSINMKYLINLCGYYRLMDSNNNKPNTYIACVYLITDSRSIQ